MMERFQSTIRAHVTRGSLPEVALAMCSCQPDVTHDGHVCPAPVGVAVIRTGAITIADAGHLESLPVSGGAARFVETSVGLPLGVQECAYEPAQVPLELGATLVAFSDGRVECRHENIDGGHERLARTVEQEPSGAGRDALVVGTGSEPAEADVTMQALRWTGHG